MKWQKHQIGKHTTIIETAEELISELKYDPTVMKGIGLGLIKPTKSSNGKKAIKFSANSGCLTLTIRGTLAVQIIRMYCHDIVGAKSEVIRAAEKLGFQIR